MELNEFFTTVILTAAVFAALVTSIANIIISLMNNWRLKKIEKQKQMNEIDKYRYSRLYELILNWHKYDSAQRGDTAEEIAFYRLLNLFMDDSGRYEIAKPLLDKCYIEELEVKKTEGEKLLNDLVGAELPDGTHSEVNNPVPVSLLSGDRKPQIRFLGNHHSGSGNLYHKSFRM